MRLPRRQLLHMAVGAAALPAVSRFARAETYPSRSVRLIAPFPAGGVVDLFARLIGQWLSERLGQPFNVENRSGAGGNIGIGGRARGPGWLHVAPSFCGQRVERDPVRQPQFQFHPRHRADRKHLSRNRRPRRAPVDPGEFRSRVDRLRQGQSGQDQHGFGWCRQRPTCLRGTVQNDGRRRHAPCARGGAPALIDLLAGLVPLMFDSLRRRSSTSGPASYAHSR
jgi:hypothetical protein